MPFISIVIYYIFCNNRIEKITHSIASSRPFEKFSFDNNSRTSEIEIACGTVFGCMLYVFVCLLASMSNCMTVPACFRSLHNELEKTRYVMWLPYFYVCCHIRGYCHTHHFLIGSYIQYLLIARISRNIMYCVPAFIMVTYYVL